LRAEIHVQISNFEQADHTEMLAYFCSPQEAETIV
jgi:hypothetical protein